MVELRRAELLIEAGLALASELSRDAVLQRIVELAVQVADARYGALGVLGADGRISDFITVGMTDAQRDAIGHIPVGLGVLGLLIHEARPLRLADISKHPSSVGFPANHPPMRSFLGVPVEARGRVFGNLYLTEKRGAAEFDEDDERALVILATQAGVAIENARLYAEAAQREARADAVREVSMAILGGTAGDELLSLVARRARELVGADVATVAVTNRPGSLELRVAEGLFADRLIGTEFLAGESVSGEVMSLGRSRRFEDLTAEPKAAQPVVVLGEIGPALFVPLGSREGPIGTLAVANRRDGSPFSDEDLELVEAFAIQAAVGLEYSRARQEVERLLVVEDRERIAKELHDGAIQALFAVGMGLQGAASMATESPMRERLESAVGEIDGVIRDLRNYIFGLRPGILADRQLNEAVRALVDEFTQRTGIVAAIEIEPEAAARLASRAGDVVQLCREALSNVARHSGADTCRVSIARTDGDVRIEVDDDGKGFDPSMVSGGSGLPNLRSRLDALGGELEIESTEGEGTLVRITLPG